MFALSRPILFTFISRTRNAEVTVAALRIAFDFAMIFHMPLNPFRHLFVTFGEKDLPGLRRFMGKVVAGMSLTMLLITITPLSSLCLQFLLGVSPDLARDARQAIFVLCLVPLVVTVRNYFHGLSLLRRRTLSMGVGAVIRNAAILLCAWVCFQTGVLHATWVAALVLVFGFAVETAVVMAAFFRARATPCKEV